VVQTFGEGAKFHPHLHALCSRGGWTASGEWIPLPYVDEAAAERLFRHKVLALLRRRGLLSQERIELLDSWRRSGFSVHNRVVVHPRDQREFFALVRYRMRPAVSLVRLHFTPGSKEVLYVPKAGHDGSEPAEGERIDAMEFVARVLVQIPAPKRHLVRYYGAYSNAARGKRKKAAAPAEPSSPHEAPEDVAIPDEPYRAALRRRWAELIRRVYEVDPLVCPRCGGEMRVVGFITQPHVIKRILDHLRKRNSVARPPPHSPQPVACPA
jgi:Putative transposase